MKEKEPAESVRKKATERMKDSKKKASQDSGLEPGLAAGGKKSRKSATGVVEFLKEKAKNEQTQWQEEMELGRKEREENAKQQQGVLELSKGRVRLSNRLARLCLFLYRKHMELFRDSVL